MAGDVDVRVLAERLDERMDGYGRELADMRSMLARISDAVTDLVRVETAQTALFEAIAELKRAGQARDERLDELEREMPSLKEIRRWVIGGIGSILLAFVTAVMTGKVSIAFGG